MATDIHGFRSLDIFSLSWAIAAAYTAQIPQGWRGFCSVFNCAAFCLLFPCLFIDSQAFFHSFKCLLLCTPLFFFSPSSSSPPKHPSLCSFRPSLNLRAASLGACIFSPRACWKELAIKGSGFFSHRREGFALFSFCPLWQMWICWRQNVLFSSSPVLSRSGWSKCEPCGGGCRKGTQCLGTFKVWGRAKQFSKLLLVPVSAWGSSLAPDNPLLSARTGCAAWLLICHFPALE